MAKNSKKKMENKVYVSYSWNVEDRNKIVDKLEQACQQRDITLLRDKNEQDYIGSIHKYMDELATGDAIILVLSDAYFKSRFCMYELCKVYKRDDFRQRIFPIVVTGTCFTNTEDRETYINYWKQKVADKKEFWKDVDPENMSSESHTEIKECAEICREVDKLLAVLADTNTLTEDIHVDSNFEALLDQIQPPQQQDDIRKTKHRRQSDENFRKKISIEIQKILTQQTNLTTALLAEADKQDMEKDSLVDKLCQMEFENAIDDLLYPAT